MTEHDQSTHPEQASGPKGHGAHFIPSPEECRRWWDRFEMFDHVREHSRQVAQVAQAIASLEVGPDRKRLVRLAQAGGLLHDLAKTYTIRHGGNHSQLGGAWVMALTGNPVLAQGIVHHVHWPFELDVERFLPQITLIYADKRVRHTEIVTLEERFEDLLERYGRTEEIKRRIAESMRQAQTIEALLSERLGVNLDARTVDRGRLVERA